MIADAIKIRLLVAFAALLWFTMTAAAQPASQSTSELVRSARRALDAGAFDQALAMYELARQRLPRSAEIPYNMAIAQYRKGNFEQASELFAQSHSLADDPRLRASSAYNMGNAAYAQSLKALPGQGQSGDPSAQLQHAADELKRAMESYKRAIDADPQDADAKANAELSHRLLKQIQQMQQQSPQQQQQNPSQDSQQPQEQQQQQQPAAGSEKQNQSAQQKQSQQQDAGSDSSDQNQPSQPRSSVADQSPQSQPSERPQSQEPESQSEPPDPAASVEAQSTSQSQPMDQGEHVQHQPQAGKTMTRQEAERLLQIVRDKERKRRAELARREAAKYAPAEKDW